MADDFKIRLDLETGGGVPILHIKGEITSEADEEIMNTYNLIPEAFRSRIILNFAETSYINSAGIATLISLITKVSEHSGKVEFSGLNAHFRKVMDIVGLTDFVVIHDNLDKALA